MDSAERSLKKYVPEEKERRVFARVFDESTIMAVHLLAARGNFDLLEHVVSTGKEAHVFRAVHSDGTHRAVKIYKIATSDFKHMADYVHGDPRFRHVKGDKRSIVHAWARKEFKNLMKAGKAGVRVPEPKAMLENVLVMEFIGERGEASKTVKEVGVPDLEAAYKKVIEYMARLMYIAKLVHADLSEYNMLVRGNEIVLIDMGQAVLTSHPRAKEFFERDAGNIANYFTKQGLEKSFEQVLDDVRAWKAKLKGAG